MSTLVTSTSTRDLRPIGYEGVLVVESWQALCKILGQKLGPAYATLLAEPVIDPTRGETDWYAELPADGGAADAATLVAASDMIAASAAVARSLIGSAETRDRLQGEILLRALSFPGNAFVRRGTKGPVLIGWGHEAAGIRASDAELSAIGALSRRPPPGEVEPFSAPAVEPPAPAKLAFDVPVPPTVPVRQTRSWSRRTLIALPSLAAFLIAAALFGPRLPGPACNRNLTVILPLLVLLLLLLLAASGGGRLLWRLWAARDFAVARRLGTGAGAMQILLAWSDLNDLDLHVICPDGGHISFQTPLVSGGRLDHDANARRPDAAPPTARPIENVFWSTSPPPGLYRVMVDPYEMRVRQRSPFRIAVRMGSRTVAVARGIASDGVRMQLVHQFEVPP